MSNIGSSTSIQNNFQINSNQDISSIGRTLVGAGNAVRAAQVPPVDTKSAGGASLTADIRLSFANFGVNLSPVNTEILLAQVAVAMRDAETAAQKGKIDVDTNKKQAAAADKQAKLEEAQTKFEEAQKKKESASLIDKIKLAFEWVGAILAVAIAAVMIATGVGAVVGAALMIGAITAVVMAIDSTVKAATDGKFGIASGIGKAMSETFGFEFDAEKAAKADMGFSIALAGIGILTAVFSLGAGFMNAGKAVGSAAGTAAKVADSVADAADTALKAKKMAANVLNTANTVNDIGTASANAASTAYTFEASKASSEAKDLQGKAKIDQAMMEQLNEMIDQALARMMAAGDRFNQILDGIMEAVNDRGNSLSRARFSA